MLEWRYADCERVVGWKLWTYLSTFCSIEKALRSGKGIEGRSDSKELQNGVLGLRVSGQEARSILESVEHGSFRRSLRTAWKVQLDENGSERVRAQSICWLFCWGAAEGLSMKTARQAREAFDKIFLRSYDWWSARLSISCAKKFRYQKGDIELEFRSALGR